MRDRKNFFKIAAASMALAMAVTASPYDIGTVTVHAKMVTTGKMAEQIDQLIADAPAENESQDDFADWFLKVKDWADKNDDKTIKGYAESGFGHVDNSSFRCEYRTKILASLKDLKAVPETAGELIASVPAEDASQDDFAEWFLAVKDWAEDNSNNIDAAELKGYAESGFGYVDNSSFRCEYRTKAYALLKQINQKLVKEADEKDAADHSDDDAPENLAADGYTFSHISVKYKDDKEEIPEGYTPVTSDFTVTASYTKDDNGTIRIHSANVTDFTITGKAAHIGRNKYDISCCGDTKSVYLYCYDNEIFMRPSERTPVTSEGWGQQKTYDSIEAVYRGKTLKPGTMPDKRSFEVDILRYMAGSSEADGRLGSFAYWRTEPQEDFTITGDCTKAGKNVFSISAGGLSTKIVLPYEGSSAASGDKTKDGSGSSGGASKNKDDTSGDNGSGSTSTGKAKVMKTVVDHITAVYTGESLKAGTAPDMKKFSVIAYVDKYMSDGSAARDSYEAPYTGSDRFKAEGNTAAGVNRWKIEYGGAVVYVDLNFTAPDNSSSVNTSGSGSGNATAGNTGTHGTGTSGSTGNSSKGNTGSTGNNASTSGKQNTGSDRNGTGQTAGQTGAGNASGNDDIGYTTKTDTDEDDGSTSGSGKKNTSKSGKKKTSKKKKTAKKASKKKKTSLKKKKSSSKKKKSLKEKASVRKSTKKIKKRSAKKSGKKNIKKSTKKAKR